MTTFENDAAEDAGFNHSLIIIFSSKKQLLSYIKEEPFSINTHPKEQWVFIWVVYQTLFFPVQV